VGRGLLQSRYALPLALLTLGAIGWNAYVALHDDGVVEGRVVGSDGRPVTGARVTLSERTLTTLEPRATVDTDAEGVFRFVGQPAHHFALEARKDGGGVAPRTLHRRWFRGQNLRLAEPLLLGPGS
jgi:Carboxypeptidase regulatory-like domain